MYQYFKGYIIREGSAGISGEQLRTLYEDVEWISHEMPTWQNEKFKFALKNSTWAFTVWYKSELIGMVRVISDKMMVASIQDLMVLKEHRKKGIGRKLIELCLQKLPHGGWSAQTTPENYEFYKLCGFEMPNNLQSETLTFNGYFRAKKDGHR